MGFFWYWYCESSDWRKGKVKILSVSTNKVINRERGWKSSERKMTNARKKKIMMKMNEKDLEDKITVHSVNKSTKRRKSGRWKRLRKGGEGRVRGRGRGRKRTRIRMKNERMEVWKPKKKRVVETRVQLGGIPPYLGGGRHTWQTGLSFQAIQPVALVVPSLTPRGAVAPVTAEVHSRVALVLIKQMLLTWNLIFPLFLSYPLFNCVCH